MIRWILFGLALAMTPALIMLGWIAIDPDGMIADDPYDPPSTSEE